MKRKIIIILAVAVFSAPQLFAQITQMYVDGAQNPSNIVITGRNPVLSWQYDLEITSFTITVSSDAVFGAGGELWHYGASTTTLNTLNRITRIAYNDDGGAQPLSAGATYYWMVMIFATGGLTFDSASFTTVASGVSLPGEDYDLTVDWNNPFNPSEGEYTVFRYMVKDRDRNVRLRIFTVSGELVKEWGEQRALKDAWYSETWDGKSDSGNTVKRGIYLINMYDVTDATSKTRKVAVIDGE